MAAYEAGVPIYAGTDAGGVLPHGGIAGEVAELAAYGIPAEDALGAASWRAREWLGCNATLDEGAPADFVVYDADPRQDVAVLRDAGAGRAAGRRRRLSQVADQVLGRRVLHDRAVALDQLLAHGVAGAAVDQEAPDLVAAPDPSARPGTNSSPRASTL